MLSTMTMSLQPTTALECARDIRRLVESQDQRRDVVHIRGLHGAIRRSDSICAATASHENRAAAVRPRRPISSPRRIVEQLRDRGAERVRRAVGDQSRAGCAALVRQTDFRVTITGRPAAIASRTTLPKFSE